MARARNPNRDKAFKIYLDSHGKIKLKDIADQLDIPDSRIRKWKTEDKWDKKIKERSDSGKGALLLSDGSEKEQKRKPGGQPGNNNAKGHGAPLGNKNGLGNNGGPPVGNKNAVTTGKYERIWYDCLDEDEQALCENLNTDELIQVNSEIELITLRERRMMKRIQEYSAKVEDIETRTTNTMSIRRERNKVYDEATGQMKDSIIAEMIPKEIVQTKKSLLDKILKIENHLTDIQAKKAKLIELKHKIMQTKGPEDDENDTNGEDSFKTALMGQTAEVWGNGT